MESWDKSVWCSVDCQLHELVMNFISVPAK